MPQLWHDLVLKSKNIDASLVVVKRKFTEVCMDEYEHVYVQTLKFSCQFKIAPLSILEMC